MAHDDFLEELRATFMVEAQEHVAAISGALQAVQRGGADPGAAVETMFRAAHSLKGAARAVDLGEVEAVCQSLEEIFALWHKHGRAPVAGVQDALHQVLDALAALLAGDPAALRQAMPDLAARQRRLRLLAEAPAPSAGVARNWLAAPAGAAAHAGSGDAASPAAVPPPGAAAVAGDAFVRVAQAKLETQLQLAEEMLGIKLAGAQRLADWQAVAELVPQWQLAFQRVERDAYRLRRSAPADGALARVLDFLDWSDRFLGAQGRRFTGAARSARPEHEEAAKQIDALLDGARELFGLPFSTVAAPFARLVRDLSREQDKQAMLVVRGENVEMDRRVLQEIKDPLLHLLRNAVDHGVEAPPLRVARGKPPLATLTLQVERLEDQKVCLTLEDDGNGLDTERLRAAAVAAGLLREEDAARMDESAAQALVFQSGLSTARSVTAVSGRGLGLAIVREKAERLGGDVQVHSRAGQGTRFALVLPARWAAFRGVLVEVAGSRLVVPTAAVERVARVGAQAVHTVEGRDTVLLEGRTLALADLAQVLALPRRPRPARAGWQIVVVVQGARRVAFAVDAVLDEREVLLKPLVRPLLRVRNIAAAAVLGSGELVPVLHAGDLLRGALRAPGLGAVGGAADVPPGARSILLAEDSITSRMLLKSILESAGHQVVTAADGRDAWAKLRAGAFDLLVSDVEMPGLDGFELTRRVRADHRMAALPVVLVTTLHTAQDQARGLAAGANAYIAKGSFDQNHLIETIARLR